jgi:hypothetical protein
MDDFRARLMQMMAGRGAADASTQLQDLLLARINQRPQEDPLRDVVAQMLAQRRAPASKPKADPHALLRAARDALNAMQARSAVIAAALGGCGLCWGEELECPECKGAGRPGWRAPDPAAFETWVAPAIRAAARGAGESSDPERKRPAARYRHANVGDKAISEGGGSP